ncbi:MAG: WD40/YVTN/BNR-like repeat-containing protein, partial [Nitrospirota bacterium]
MEKGSRGQGCKGSRGFNFGGISLNPLTPRPLDPFYSIKGMSIIAVIAAMLILSVIGLTLISIVAVDSDSSINQLRSGQAQYIAEAGIEIAIRYITKRDCASPPCSCSSITGNALFTNVSLGRGSFNVIAAYYRPDPPTTLNGGISNDPLITSILANNSSGYAAYGRILLGSESIDYTQISGNNFTGAKRGADTSTVATHSDGTSIMQNQCTITSTGVVNNGKRVVRITNTMQDGWTVGKKNANLITMLRWIDNTWVDKSISTGSSPTNEEVKSISMVSSNDGWAVGKKGTILQWNGSNWSTVTSPTNQDLESVSMVDANNGWAVGKKGEIIQWDGSNWSTVTSPTNEDLKSISMVSSNDGFAVGKKGEIIQWDGSNWSTVTSPTNQDLESV